MSEGGDTTSDCVIVIIYNKVSIVLIIPILSWSLASTYSPSSVICSPLMTSSSRVQFNVWDVVIVTPSLSCFSIFIRILHIDILRYLFFLLCHIIVWSKTSATSGSRDRPPH